MSATITTTETHTVTVGLAEFLRWFAPSIFPAEHYQCTNGSEAVTVKIQRKENLLDREADLLHGKSEPAVTKYSTPAEYVQRNRK